MAISPKRFYGAAVTAARYYKAGRGAMKVGLKRPYSFTQTATTTKRQRTVSPNVSIGNYAGKFVKRFGKKRAYKRGGKRSGLKRKYPRKRVYAKGENYYATRGATSTIETTGSVTDTDCVYVGHSSLVGLESISIVAYAVMRKAYKIAIGWDCANVNDDIPFKAGASDGHKWIVTYADNLVTGTTTAAQFSIGVNTTLKTVADTVLSPIFREFSVSDSNWSNRRLLSLVFEDTDNFHSKCELNFESMHVDFFSKSELKIQNRTQNGSDNEADDVNNVPLVGRSYRMTGPTPRCRDKNLQYINWVSAENGMTLYRASKYSGPKYVGWKEPPPSTAFVNCKQSAVVRLEPGQIKSDWLSTKVKLPLDKFLRRLHMLNANPGGPTTGLGIGNHGMIALERLIGVDNTKVNVVYEANHMHGCVVTVKPKPNMLQDYKQYSYSEIQP